MTFFDHFFVASVLKSSRTSKYAAVLRAGAPKTDSKNFHLASSPIMVKTISEQIESITGKIERIIENTPELKEKLEILETILGIGKIVAFELLVLLPELGKLCRRRIASLAGVAPRANESGKFYGYRRTGHGRFGIKRMLFLAAMAARRSHTNLKEFYEKLIGKGKKKMVALVALMRKILVIANARLKDLAIKTV